MNFPSQKQWHHLNCGTTLMSYCRASWAPGPGSYGVMTLHLAQEPMAPETATAKHYWADGSTRLVGSMTKSSLPPYNRRQQSTSIGLETALNEVPLLMVKLSEHQVERPLAKRDRRDGRQREEKNSLRHENWDHRLMGSGSNVARVLQPLGSIDCCHLSGTT